MKSRQPLVCICIPLYNNEKTIRCTLDSLLDQDYENLIIKVFDNASIDSSLAIAHGYALNNPNVIVFSREETVSGEDNFNTCIENADGDYTAIFHSDDVYDSRIISAQVAFLEKHLQSGAVSTHADVIDKNGVLISERFIPNELRNCDASGVELTRNELLTLIFGYGNFVTCPSVLFRTKILKEDIKKFRGDLFMSSSDLDVWLRISEVSNFGFIPQKLIRYRKSDASFSYNLAKVRIEDHDMFLVLNYYLDKFNDNKKDLNKKLDFLLMKDRANTNLNRMALNSGDFKLIKMSWCGFSVFHAKYYLIALMVKFILKVPFKEKLFGFLIRELKIKNA
ncbi:glycosyltransferase family 2 protein [Marinospirillum minutulum]|uniref:glycosyltransferase family 2 protein n=1 Tax=Marinospirillum minutulum TaxID=64974 RepID=UPI00040313F5|nr:glycosyltransferase family A protein [Marinospirillum minutulum]